MAISTNPKPTIYRNLYENTSRFHCIVKTKQQLLTLKLNSYCCLLLHDITRVGIIKVALIKKITFNIKQTGQLQSTLNKQEAKDWTMKLPYAH